MTPAGVVTIIHTFAGGTDGSNPVAGLILASDGNFYGTTYGFNGGSQPNDGTIFRLTPEGQLTTLHNFNGPDGHGPGKLVQGSDQNLYGTTATGGHFPGNGTIFKMALQGQFNTIYFFEDDTDGNTPVGGLAEGNDGNFYGATEVGGRLPSGSAYGTIFKVTPAGMLTTLHTFNFTDGAYPAAPLVKGTDGNLYGTTSETLASTIFKITSLGTFSTLYKFGTVDPSKDGYRPVGRLLQASDGSFYGTTQDGGQDNYGIVFRITSTGTYKIIHSFDSMDGSYPLAGLIQTADGSFYGTTQQGARADQGTIFRLTLTDTPFTTLYSFDDISHGSSPHDLILARDGNFYGTTESGGNGSCGCQPGFSGQGTIFKITPTGAITTLHRFSIPNGGPAVNYDGYTPAPRLAEGSDGNFYGTTSSGGTAGNSGIVFKITPAGAFTPLHNFSLLMEFFPGYKNADGAGGGALTEYTPGLFIGVSPLGGSHTCGTIYKVTATGGFATLCTFNLLGSIGNLLSNSANTPLLKTNDGFLYGTTDSDGTRVNLRGSFFKFNPSNGALTILHHFADVNNIPEPGSFPDAPLIRGNDGNFYGNGAKITPTGTPTALDSYRSSAQLLQASDGNFYGATEVDGDGYGTIFRLSLTGVFTRLHTFRSNEGHNPICQLIEGNDGNLYGTTIHGGPHDAGTFFKLGVQLPGPPRPQSDFNADRHADLILQNPSTHQTTIWSMNDAFRIANTPSRTLPSGWTLIDATQFGAVTSAADFVLFNPSTGRTTIWYMNGPLLWKAFVGPTIPVGLDLVLAQDFNGDARPDLLLYNRFNGSTAIWYLAGVTHYATAAGPTIPAGWKVIGSADFNHDNKPDLLLWYASLRTTRIWYLNGAQLTGSAAGPTLPAGYIPGAVDDFNRDTKPDLVIWNPTTRHSAIWHLNNNLLLNTALSPDIPAGWLLSAPR